MPIEPYDAQRRRHKPGEYPRPPQPGIQPNRLPKLKGWGMGSSDYWSEVFNDYLKRRKK